MRCWNDISARRGWRGEGCTHGRVGDLALLNGNVEVDANEDTLALEVEVCNGELVGEGHGGGRKGYGKGREGMEDSFICHGI